jgi:hypothetical protein
MPLRALQVITLLGLRVLAMQGPLWYIREGAPTGGPQAISKKREVESLRERSM